MATETEISGKLREREVQYESKLLIIAKLQKKSCTKLQKNCYQTVAKKLLFFFSLKVAQFIFFKKLRKQLQQTCKKLPQKFQQVATKLQKVACMLPKKVAKNFFRQLQQTCKNAQSCKNSFKKLQKQLQQTFTKLQIKVA